MGRRRRDDELIVASGSARLPAVRSAGRTRPREGAVLQLQRTAGNAATTLAIQRMAVSKATQAGWPATVTIGGATWGIESASDGLVYRVPGVRNPHITIHGMTSADPHSWDQQFHVVMGGKGEKPYDYHRDEESFFMPTNKKAAATMYRNRAAAGAIATAFYGAVKAALA